MDTDFQWRHGSAITRNERVEEHVLHNTASSGQYQHRPAIHTVALSELDACLAYRHVLR